MRKKVRNQIRRATKKGDVATEAAFALAERAIALKRQKDEEYPPEWEDPEFKFIREKIAPALLNEMLAILPSVLD
jgi:hypothetical protein